jgi:hypothetical protein
LIPADFISHFSITISMTIIFHFKLLRNDIGIAQ